MILTAIKSYFLQFKFYFVAAAVIALALYIAYLNVSLGVAKGSLAKEKGYNAQLQTENDDLIRKNSEWRLAFDDLNKSTAKCNDSITALELAAQKVKKDVAEAIKKGQAISQHREDQIKQADARPANPGGGCSASVTLAKQDLRGKP